MARLTFRAKLNRSNPSLIRYFEIDDRHTVDDLIQTVMILFGLENPNSTHLNWGKTVISAEDLIRDRLSPAVYDDSQSLYTITCGVDFEYALYYSYEKLITTVNLTFSLELETEYAQWEAEKTVEGEWSLKDSDGPRLIGWRGPNLIPYGRSLADINGTMTELIQGNISHINGRGYVQLSDYLPDEGAVNQELYKRIVMGISKIKLNRDRGVPLSRILNVRDKGGLADIIFFQNLPLSYHGSKDRLLKNIMTYYNTSEFWLQLISEMPAQEYEGLVNLLRVDADPSSKSVRLITMSNYGLLGVLKHVLVVPTEFLIWFEKYLNSKESTSPTERRKGGKMR